MHAETLAYMLHQLPLNHESCGTPSTDYRWSSSHSPQCRYPRGLRDAGLDRNSDTFGWDNEYEAHSVEVPAFEIDRYKVTNRQYLEFIAAGGYETRAFWNDDDWNWKAAQEISHPLFWKKEGNGWL